MKKTIEQYFCDLCYKESDVQKIKFPVVFHTEQTEGRSCDPYVSMQDIDMCGECRRKVLSIHGYGAQGLNRYEVTDNA